MDFRKHFEEIMNKCRDLALATCNNNIPNVRILDFYYHRETPGTVHFCAFKDSPKMSEIKKNSRVSFSTIPNSTAFMEDDSSWLAVVRVFGGYAKELHELPAGIEEGYYKKFPYMAERLKGVENKLAWCAVHFTEAHVDVDMENGGKVTL